MGSVILPVVVAAGIGLASPLLLAPFLRRLGVIDVPNARSSHAVPVIRGAGTATSLALASGLGVAVLASAAIPSPQRGTLVIILVSGATAALVGLAEDVRGLPIRIRAAAQLMVGALATWALVVEYGGHWGWVIVGSIAVAAYVNVANFMDGIDGISGAHGAIFGIAFAGIGLIVGLEWLLIVGLVVAVSFASFLPWNLLRGKMFLGDVGSYLLGATVATISIAAVLAGVPVLAVVGMSGIYFADTGVTLFRRIIRREKWYESHRTHIYQQLTDSGLSHIHVTLLVAAFTCVAASVGLLALLPLWWSTPAAIVGVAAVVWCYLTIPGQITPRAAGAIGTSNNPLVSAGALSDVPAIGEDSDGQVASRAVHEEGIEMEKQRWAVIGATGFIGSALVAGLRAKGIEVAVVAAPRLFLTPAEARKDFGSDDIVARELSNKLVGANVVINAAGVASPDSAADESLYGANALLPLVAADAAARAGCSRFIHLSSAAVQGRRRILDESPEVAPFSPYSESKAIGERALSGFESRARVGAKQPEVIIVRATSVQGQGRRTTAQLQKLARSPLASVANPGNQPTVVSSLESLVQFIWQVGRYPEKVAAIVLQPWEKMTTRQVLFYASGREPRRLPARLCASVIATGYWFAKRLSGLNGHVRRVELMWFGQAQDAQWASEHGIEVAPAVEKVLAPGTRVL